MSKTNSTIVDLFASAGAADLEAIDAKIADLEARAAAVRGEIDSLRVIRKAIDVKVHGKPARKSPRRKAMPASAVATAGTTQDKIIAAIEQHGPLSGAQIEDLCGLSRTQIGVTVAKSRSLELRNGLVYVK